MLPVRDNTSVEIVDNFEVMPTKTHKIQMFGDRIYGKIDKLKAMEQACFKILNTERYDYIIYSWNYGIELKDLFGKPKNYCKVVLTERIKEALKQDDRVLDVYNFSFTDLARSILAVTFNVSTIYGEINMRKEVQI
ncbi:DUF2634 domain-containing protein [Fusobacterium sp. SYSU M8A802]